MILRYFVEKQAPFNAEALALTADLKSFLGLKNLEAVRIINCYLLEGLDSKYAQQVADEILATAQLDRVYTAAEMQTEVGFCAAKDLLLAYLPGQFDQRADSVAACVQILTQTERVTVKSAKLYKLCGDLSADELSKIKQYLLNPLEMQELDFNTWLQLTSLQINYSEAAPIKTVEGFLTFGKEELAAFAATENLAMDLADLSFCQAYFRSENREPSISEIKVIDTYWSDHCRHTCFLTVLQEVEIQDPLVEAAYNCYLDRKIAFEKAKGRAKPVSFMDIATLPMRLMRADGSLSALEESEEINACSVKIKLPHDGKLEDWLLLFKNETHNHPTEIEPFGGAATCIGGAIRDPLSSRAYVYGAMRVSGAADPTVSLAATLPAKLPQRKICQTAAHGYSSYGNQIGVATGLVDEVYHPGYVAKRLEVGAVIGAAPLANVRRERPRTGDVVILLGGATGRDGLGGATGSSKAHTQDSLHSCGAEVQKGNAPEERKLQRLFRNPVASKLIKRCNDFGAGGVSVAIGELADSLLIDLDKVPKKYAGLDGTELAISESQERMAVVVAAKSAAEFIKLANDENLTATVVAEVKDNGRLQMLWRKQVVVDLSREFLNSNGAAKKHRAIVAAEVVPQREVTEPFAASYRNLVSDLNVCSKKALAERFDSSIGAGTVLHPYGGNLQLTPIQTMVQKISVPEGDSDLCSAMTYAFNPYILQTAPFHGAYLAVVEAIAKLLAAGVPYSDIYLTLQEYFCKLGDDSWRWGKPLAALLGAFKAQLDFGVPAIGGKDSMSGSFLQLDVPNTLIAFAVATCPPKRVISPEFKNITPYVYLLEPQYTAALPDVAAQRTVFAAVAKLTELGVIDAAYAVSYGGVAEAVYKMCLGNNLGFTYNADIALPDLFKYKYGSFVLAANCDLGILLERLTLTQAEAEAAATDRADSDSFAPATKDCLPLTANYKLTQLGAVTDTAAITYGGESIKLAELKELSEARLESVYRSKPEDKAAEMLQDSHLPDLSLAQESFSNANSEADFAQTPLVAAKSSLYQFNFNNTPPQVLIPVFPGTNCEYDSAKLVKAAGFKPEIFVVNTLNSEKLKQSVRELAQFIKTTQIIFLPGGFSGADEPEGSAKLIAAFFRNSEIAAAVNQFLAQGGLMLGICNGFQALVKLGLLPYGKITLPQAGDPILSFNTISRHQAKIVRCKIVNTNSPWLQKVRSGTVYNVAISHGEGRFYAGKEQLAELIKKRQIVSQYVDLQNKATMDIQYNPNGSLLAIEAISALDGRILGKMGHSERIGKYLYKNVPGNYDMGLFKSAAGYFKL